MKSSLRRATALLACCSCFAFANSTGTIALDARAAHAGTPTYVKAGVPFPQGVLRSENSLALKGKGGRNQPAQYEVLAKWPDNSIKSVLVSTMLAGEGKQALSLQYGGAVAAPSTTSLKARENADVIQVTTGPLKFQVSKSKFALLDGVWRDSNNDGSFSRDERLTGPGEIYYVSAHDKQRYSTGNFSKPTVELEESGPVRVVIRARGKLFNSSARELTNFDVRIYAYAGSDQIDIEYTLIDSRPDRSARDVPEKLPLAAMEYGIRIPHAMGRGNYHFGGDGKKTHSGTITDEHYILQTGRMNFVNGDLEPRDTFSTRYKGVANGRRASGWAAVSNSKSTLASYVQDFWQEFPNEISLTAKELHLRFHPARSIEGKADQSYPKLDSSTGRFDRPNTFYSPRVGMAKTNRVRLGFYAGVSQPTEMIKINSHYQKHAPLMLASRDWITKSGVFGKISTSDSYTRRYDNWLMSSIYELSFKEGKRPILYGWRDYGDRMYHGWIDEVDGVRIPGFYNDAHVGSNAFFRQYLRTGDERWWHTAEIATRHFMDIDISHSKRYGRHGHKGKKIWSPPGEFMLISHGNWDHSTRGIHLGHSHVSGMTDLYLLTGDKRTKDVLDMAEAWWAHMTPYFFPSPRPASPDGDERTWAEAERDFGWPLYTMNELARVSDNPNFHRKVSAQLVNHLIDWWKTPSKHEINGSVLGRNDSRNGTGWWAMDEMDNGDGNGTNPWMAGALLSALIEFYEYDQLLPSGIDQSELKDMMWQTLNYVVKYGWNDKEKFFAYSEARIDENGGADHLLYPIAYLHQLLEQEKRAGLVAHPEWYDTSDQWYSIVRNQSERFRSGWVGGEQDYGFYGYEMIFPVDFFDLMRNLERPAKRHSSAAPAPARTELHSQRAD